jgi:alkylation response protein AidB-like acyl-CoA dehydrogenase
VDGIAWAESAAIAAHEAVKRVLYETSQFHGAIGLTLEYPLHLWTYRLRVLQFELAEAVEAAARNRAGEGV